ncbi:hypothetical protein [Vitiosangium sp. GDMCC 1.1324]|uniref:hypothetical protein n=1 Tax=Vitiosangium sp. (strain GDMCC 1.1324) TaxID=2138576 RepID=UPI000D3D1E1F|nr:hypothetical protein [Vitiosangium sp. GDMCC 1.1324]PTL79379.1 hypothetical protein DAT35_34865 [Vitiosangium sp. GDMCC 1.1324]
MNRRLIGLLAALCLTSACKEEPVGKMEPIPRPPDMPAAPAKKAEAPKPAPAPEPPPDPSKVTLRWKLDAPTAFRLTTTASESAPPPPAPKGKKDKAPPAPAARQSETTAIFVLQKTESGDYAFRIVPQGPGGEADQGTMSERGFVLDGLSGPLRNTAVLVLELPRDAVGQDAAWALGTDLVDMGSVPNFVEKKAERRNQVKLTALTPGDNGEQVATLEYDLSETISGQLRPSRQSLPKPPKLEEAHAKKGADKHDDHDEDETPAGPPAASAGVQVKGRGEFLVKAGRWRSWEATITTSIEGATLPGTLNGERKLRLTPLDSVPADLLQPQAKK